MQVPIGASIVFLYTTGTWQSTAHRSARTV
jgi:hypothetical protein